MVTSILIVLTNFIVHTITTLGYPGVALLMAIESAAVPLPSEVIMPFAGFGVYSGNFTLFGVALAGAIGSALGSALTYWVGFKGGRPLIERYGKYLLISKHDLELSDKFFARFGLFATFIGRILPVFRTYISIPAGISRVPFWKFIWYSIVGSFIWSLLLAYIGLKLGERWASLRERFHNFDLIIIALIVVGLGLWVYRHFKNSK